MLKGDKSEITPWCHMFMTVVFRKAEVSRGRQQCQNHQQPLPDFRRWLYSKGKLHCLPYEGKRLRFPNRPWNSVPGYYLPSHILDLAYALMPKPSGALRRPLALLCWLPEHEVLQCFEEENKDEKKDIHDAMMCKKKKESLTVWSKIRNTGKHVERLESCRE